MDALYWNNRYLNNDAPWDIGYVSTPLKTYIDGFTQKDARILIPGCGNAYEAEYLLQQGFTDITLIDISPAAVEKIEKRLGKYSGQGLKIVLGDFFEMEGQFDLIIEQTFLSALEPTLRTAYVNKMAELLVEGGKLAGVLFNKEFEGGPPFGGTNEEYAKMFASKFLIKTLENCYNSIPPRAGNEVFINLIRK